MSARSLSRRDVIGRAALSVPAFAAAAFVARGAFAASCADPTDSLRESLHYVEASPDPQKTCSGCGFFSADGENGCGNCKIFNGPANPKGHCDSWSAKSE